MKEKKPFKVGATYKLKKKYVNSSNDFFRTGQIRNFYGKGVFVFTVADLDGDGDAVDCNGVLIANSRQERHAFSRVDNK